MDVSTNSMTAIDLSTRSTTNLFDREGVDDIVHETSSTSSMSSSKMFAGVMEEYQRRSPYILSSDYYDFFLAPSKTISAAIFMFFATIFSTIALGAHLGEVGEYGEYIGVGEFLVMNSLSGLYFSVLSCQPLMILRPTGPITLIVENIIIISEKYHINFWQLLACSGWFVGIWMVLIAAFEGSNKIGLLTRFTHETFAFYVCSIYIYNGVNDVISNFYVDNGDGSDAFGTSLFMAVLAVLAFTISLIFTSCFSSEKAIAPNDKETKVDSISHHAVLTQKERVLSEVMLGLQTGRSVDRKNIWRILSSPESSGRAEAKTTSEDSNADCVAVRWNVLTPSIRSLISDYAVTIAVIMATVLSYAPFWLWRDGTGDETEENNNNGGFLSIDRVSVPSGLTPTMSQRSWLVSFTSQAYQSFYSGDENGENSLVSDDAFVMIAMSFAISVPIVFFFYIDQNLSCVLSQAPHIEGMKGGKGTYVHSPFLCVALSNMIGPSFGLPFVTASLPHSPQFVLALSGESTEHRSSTQGSNVVTFENRVAPLLVYSLIGLVSFVPSVIRCIPLGAVRGVLAYVGFAGILNTELFQRLVSILRPLPAPLELPLLAPDLNSSTVTMSFWRVHCFTMLQACILAFFWVLNLSPQPAGLLVAFAVAALGPLRLYVLPRYFSPEELALLDT